MAAGAADDARLDGIRSRPRRASGRPGDGKVADSYTTLRANIRAGNYGPPGSVKRKKVAATPISFRADAAQPFDARCLSWQIPAEVGGREATVSIWTTAGRLTGIRVLGAPRDLVLLRTRAIGETDLIHPFLSITAYRRVMRDSRDIGDGDMRQTVQIERPVAGPGVC